MPKTKKTETATQLVISFHHADDYEFFDMDFDNAASFIAEQGVKRVHQWVDRGFTAEPDFMDKEYIGFYWGDDDGEFVEELSKEERRWFTDALNKYWDKEAEDALKATVPSLVTSFCEEVIEDNFSDFELDDFEPIVKAVFSEVCEKLTKTISDAYHSTDYPYVLFAFERENGDVAFYKYGESGRPEAVIPGHYKNCPKRSTKYFTLNCAKWRLFWLN